MLYSLFACSVILGGLVTAISIIRGGYVGTSEENNSLYSPEERF